MERKIARISKKINVLTNSIAHYCLNDPNIPPQQKNHISDLNQLLIREKIKLEEVLHKKNSR